jgi:SagB-type dehydrogenase family enzyme
VDAWVIARAVDGLTPGAYRYGADQHGFERVDTQTDEATLGAISPFFGRVGTGAAVIDEASVPAVVVLVADLDRLRVRYGLRALRLALLEAGHAAQNIGLVAAALGMRSLHLQAYVDDEVCSRLHLDGYTRVPVAVLPVGERHEQARGTAPSASPGTSAPGTT